MASSKHRWAVAGILLLGVLVLAAGTWMIARFFFPPFWAMMGWPETGDRYGNRAFASDGERIFFTGSSSNPPSITYRMPGGSGMGMMDGMMGERLSCAGCHGENGEGGTIGMMMDSVEVPNIQYDRLTGEAHGGEEEDHPPYTDESLKRAITEGVNPAGEPLEWPMPRWKMSGEQLDDLLAFLKTLHD